MTSRASCLWITRKRWWSAPPSVLYGKPVSPQDFPPPDGTYILLIIRCLQCPASAELLFSIWHLVPFGVCPDLLHGLRAQSSRWWRALNAREDTQTSSWKQWGHFSIHVFIQQVLVRTYYVHHRREEVSQADRVCGASFKMGRQVVVKYSQISINGSYDNSFQEKILGVIGASNKGIWCNLERCRKQELGSEAKSKGCSG